jgi:hypothetical protein
MIMIKRIRIINTSTTLVEVGRDHSAITIGPKYRNPISHEPPKRRVLSLSIIINTPRHWIHMIMINSKLIRMSITLIKSVTLIEVGIISLAIRVSKYLNAIDGYSYGGFDGEVPGAVGFVELLFGGGVVDSDVGDFVAEDWV